MVKIVKLKKIHLKSLAKLGKDTWPQEEWITEKYLRNTVKSNGVFLVALANRKVVGGILVSEQDYPKMWLYYFAVDKNYRRMGIGSSLLRAAEKKIKKSTMLFTDLEKSDVSGLKFYRKNGFVVAGKVNNWFPYGRTGIIMSKHF
jgi:ribosomal protein S18 acetylase RimI-like enzyme